MSRQIDFITRYMSPYDRAVMCARGALRRYMMRQYRHVGVVLHEYEREAERAQRLAVREDTGK